ncbi:uncharacterized protein LOC141899673 [Tubulanus polymorphus]|uniref:uncharacterized protein LOC141899673 n=1 Tax=Tubulanus polymorphus TaxID=672921 RepID=UPI003DA2DBB2
MECWVWCMLVVSSLFGVIRCSGGPYDWMPKDSFDEVMDRIDSVTEENCKYKPESELVLSEDTLAQVPKYNQLRSTYLFQNRSTLLHLHNMAMNRAMFYSFILQNMIQPWQDELLPGLLYYYFSAAADVAANPAAINGSAVFYDNNCTYPNWYPSVIPFNNTMSLFGPRAWRIDDYDDPTNWLREPTNRTIDVEDYGAGPERNYTLHTYKFNQWYQKWLPDFSKTTDIYKQEYHIKIRFSNRTGELLDEINIGKQGLNASTLPSSQLGNFNFFGPPSPGEKEDQIMPVQFTAPYFDCGRSNKWIVSAVAPVVDYLPRYQFDWQHLKRHRFVAVVVMDIDFIKLDINQCQISRGNAPPNKFAGTARCKPRTLCEPLPGFGFQRGGYTCMCRSGYRYPFFQRHAYLGLNIEQSIKEEYDSGFDCLAVGLRQVNPVKNTGGMKRKKRDVSDSIHDLEIEWRERDIEDAKFELGLKEKRLADEKRIVEEMSTPEGRARRENRLREEREERLRIHREAVLNRYLKSIAPVVTMKQTPANEKPKAISDKKKQHLVSRFKRDADEAQSQLPGEKKSKIKSRKKRYLSANYNLLNARAAFNVEANDKLTKLLDKKYSVTQKTCKGLDGEELKLPGDMAYGAKVKFEMQARVALRLAHFISMFLQNVDIPEEYGILKGDKYLAVEQLFGEVIANTMGDNRIFASGCYWERDQFRHRNGSTREYFGPYAWRTPQDSLQYNAEDQAGLKTLYTEEPFYTAVKSRWATNSYGLEKFTIKPMVRADINGSAIRRFEHYPVYYRAPNIDDGHWSVPFFKCDGRFDLWLLTYSVPFFGFNNLRTKHVFKGVVTVTVSLDDMDINQCPQPFYIPNAFKNTAKCDYESQVCMPLEALKYKLGGYKCECRQNYEYPFNDERSWYFDGQAMEEEYRKMMAGENHRYHLYKCRLAGAAAITVNTVLVSALLAAYHLLVRN